MPSKKTQLQTVIPPSSLGGGAKYFRIELEDRIIDLPEDVLPKLIYEMRRIVRRENERLSNPDREAFESVLAQIRSGLPLDVVCSMAGYPSRKLLTAWCRIHPDWGLELEEADRKQKKKVFRRVMEKVMELEQKLEAEELSPTHISGIRLQIDTLKWAAAKLNPSRFADYSRMSVDQKTSWKIVYTPELVCKRCGGKIEEDPDFAPSLPVNPEKQKHHVTKNLKVRKS